jgi:hypothetical protein
MAILHAFTSTKDDDADTTLVRPINWNAAHVGLTVIRKTATETVNNSTTLQNDDHLLLAVGANDAWQVNLILRVTSTAVADFKIDFTVPASGAFSYKTTDLTLTFANQNAGTPYAFAINPSTTAALVFLYGIYIGGGTAGNLQLQWAQSTQEATDTQVLINSCLIAYQLA